MPCNTWYTPSTSTTTRCTTCCRASRSCFSTADSGRHPQRRPGCMKAEQIPRLAGDGRLALDAGFWWGLAEGLAFFIVPDVYISFAALFSLRAGAVAWLSSIAGSAVAVSLIYLLTAALGLDYLAFLESIPGISGSLIERVGARVAAGGGAPAPLHGTRVRA